MTQPTPPTCNAQYPRRDRNDRIIECSLTTGHGDHFDSNVGYWCYDATHAPPTVDEHPPSPPMTNRDVDSTCAPPPPPPPAAPTSADPYGFDLALTAEQEIRARAIDTAAYLDGGDTWHSSPQAFVRDLAAVADLIAAYIADGSTP